MAQRRWFSSSSALVAAMFATLFVSAHSYPESDRIEALPGHDKPLPSKWYSGYLDYKLPDNRVVHTHYVYVEKPEKSKDETDTARDDIASSTRRRVKQEESSDNDTSPLIFWSNGGPGASSLFGLLTEIGPFSLNDLSLETHECNRTGIPTLFENVAGSWNSLGSLLIFDAPAPVGYSYCDDKASGDGLSCGGWDDDSSTINNYYALLAFYKKFPELKTNPLYLTGESYAGIYIPSLARIILENQARNEDSNEGNEDVPSNEINLKGFAVGDGCVGTEVNCGAEAPLFNLLFFAGHGQISIKEYGKVMETCTLDELMVPGHAISPNCADILNQARKQIGGFYEYSLYDDCTYRNGLLRKKASRSGSALRSGSTGLPSGALNDYVCGGGIALEEYVRHASVKQAMHVPPDSYFFDGDNGVGFNYTPTERNLMPFYYDVAKGKYNSHSVYIKVLVYNGDVDPSINSLVAQNWTSHLGLEETESWRPWTLDACRRMGGYVTRYEGAFDFLTIRGAGHMVPTYKPESSLAFLSAWINDEPYPYFDPTCTQPR